jgi:hypothetical protein
MSGLAELLSWLERGIRFHRPTSMIRLALLTAALLFAPILPAQQTLNSLVDKSRVLLVFAPDSTDRRFVQQLSLFEHHAADFNSRDLVLIPVIPDSGKSALPADMHNFQVPFVHDDEKITLRRRFHIQPDSFTVLLLGKDGGEKLRSSSPVPVARLNRTIDAMPMRKDEMRRQQ